MLIHGTTIYSVQPTFAHVVCHYTDDISVQLIARWGTAPTASTALWQIRAIAPTTTNANTTQRWDSSSASSDGASRVRFGIKMPSHVCGIRQHPTAGSPHLPKTTTVMLSLIQSITWRNSLSLIVFPNVSCSSLKITQHNIKIK